MKRASTLLLHFSARTRKNLPKTASKLFLRHFPYAYEPKLLSYFNSARPKVSNAQSTISIAHTERARCACKVASWKQNYKIKKYRFFNFSIRPKEISIHKEYSSSLYYPPIPFRTHYQPCPYDRWNELGPLSKLRTKTQNQENPHFGQIEFKKSSKTHVWISEEFFCFS